MAITSSSLPKARRRSSCRPSPRASRCRCRPATLRGCRSAGRPGRFARGRIRPRGPERTFGTHAMVNSGPSGGRTTCCGATSPPSGRNRRQDSHRRSSPVRGGVSSRANCACWAHCSWKPNRRRPRLGPIAGGRRSAATLPSRSIQLRDGDSVAWHAASSSAPQVATTRAIQDPFISFLRACARWAVNRVWQILGVGHLRECHERISPAGRRALRHATGWRLARWQR